MRCGSEHVPRPQDPLERERALQLQIAEASRRLCHEENIGRRVRKRRQTAALREEQKLRDLEQVLIQRRLLAGQRDASTAEGEPPEPPSWWGDAGGQRGRMRCCLVGCPWGMHLNSTFPVHPTGCSPVLHPKCMHPSGCTPICHPQCLHPSSPSLVNAPPWMHPNFPSPVTTT